MSFPSLLIETVGVCRCFEVAAALRPCSNGIGVPHSADQSSGMLISIDGSCRLVAALTSCAP